MSHTINRYILNEGSHYATIQWYLESDGVAGELKNYKILDVVNDFLIPVSPQYNSEGQQLAPKITLRKVWFSTAWFDMILGFESTSPKNYITLARDADFAMDFTTFGGIKDRTPYGDNPTGNLILSTRDFAPAGTSGFMVLELRKD